MESVFLIALSGASALTIGMCGYLTNLPTYKRYGRYLLLAICCFAISAVFSVVSVYFPIFQLRMSGKELSLTESIGIVSFFFGWIIVLGVSFLAMEGAAFFERPPRFRDTVRWRIALLKGDVAEKFLKISKSQLAGPAPRGVITVEPLVKADIKEIPLGTMVFIWGPNDFDLRYWAYAFHVSHSESCSCFISFTCPAWTLFHLDNVSRKLKMKFDTGRFWVIDGYTGLFGLEELASLRGWELEKIRKNVKTCRDIFTLHKRIREFREQADKIYGGTNTSNNKIVLTHNGINFLTEDEQSIAYYLTHAAPLERQIGWIDVFTVHTMSKENYRLIFQRLYEITDLVIELSEELIDNRLKKFYQIKKYTRGNYNANKIPYELDLSDNNKFIIIE